jgi:hypothetical protein
MSLRASTPRARLIAREARRDEADLPPLVIDRVMPDGRRFRLDFTDLPHPRLARELVGVLLREMHPGGAVQSAGTAAGNRRRAISAFVRFVAREHPECERLALIEPHVIAAWERHLLAAMAPVTAWGRSSGLLSLLRAGSELLSPAMSARAQYGSALDKPSMTPVEPYSPHVAAQLVAACEKEILATVERLAEGTRLRDEGVHPGRDRELWRVRANQLMAIAERGLLPITWASTVQELGSWVTGLGVRRLYAYLYLSSRDLVPFVTLFILKSGMELQSALELRSDCLSGAGSGYVMVSYTKRRAGRVSPPPLRVKDGGRTTAGGLLRLVLRLTELSRQHSDNDLIFTAINTGGPQFFAGLTEPQLRRESRAFTARHGIHDDDSKPLGAISFRRLRKTQKALRYISARGQLDVMATGHSIEVAGTHYANVRALDDFHEQAVERALNQALGADTYGGATVMDEDTEAALAAGDRRVAEQLGLSREAAEQAARGGTDLWLARCRDFFNAPHGSPNTPCATPYFGCVGCPNALVGPSKLPAIHAFIKHAEHQAEMLAEPAWEAIYDRAYAGAAEVTGRFSRAENEAARLIAERLTVALPLEVAA